MAESSFPMADGSGVTDAAYERLMGPVIGSGRIAFEPTTSTITTAAIYADSSGRQVKCYANQAAIVRGFRWESGSTGAVVALDANTSGNPRLDLIVLRLNRSNFTVRLAKITGSPAASPSAPAPVQDTGSTGSWDLPLARARVTSNGTTGQPLIAAADVTAMDYWLTPPNITVPSGRSVPVADGQLIQNPDTKRLYFGTGTALNLLGEQGDRITITAASAWTSANCITQRVNGWVWFQATAVLNLSGGRAAGEDIQLCTMPVGYRPAGEIAFVAWLTPGQVGQGLVGTDGTVVLRNWPATLPNGGLISIAPMTWPVWN